MKKILILWLILLSLCVTATGSEISISLATGTKTDMPTQLTALETRLSAAERLIAEKIKNRQTPLLLAQMAVTEENLVAKQTALNNVKEVIQSLAQAKGLQEQLLVVQHGFSAENEQLNSLLIEINKSVETSQAIQQLLDNPINQTDLSVEQKNRLPMLISRAEALQHKAANWSETLSIDEAAINHANILLATWIAAQHKWLSEQKQSNADNEKKRLMAEKQAFEKKADNLQQQLDSEQGLLSTTQQIALQQQIDQARTQAWFSDVDARLLDLMKHGRKISQPLTQQEGLSITDLTRAELQLNKLTKQLKTLQDEVENRYSIFQKSTKIIGPQTNTDEKFIEQIKLITYQQLLLDSLPKKIDHLLVEKKQSNFLLKRPWLNTTVWKKIQANIAESLLQMVFQIKISSKAFYLSMIKNPLFSGLGALASLLLIMIILRAMRLLEKNTLKQDHYDKGFIATLKKITAALGVLRYPMAVALFILLLIRFSELPSPGDLIIQLIVYTVVSVSIGFVILNKEQKNETLTKSLNLQGSISLLCLSAFVLLYGLSSLSEVDDEVTLFYEKILMLSIMAAAVTFYRIVSHYLSQSQQKNSNKYWQGLHKILVTLLWAVLAVCLLNIIGYDLLSWLLLSYLGMLLLFILLMGLGFFIVNQLRKRTKLWSLKHLKHGAFVAQDIVSPLSFMLKLAWLYGSAKLLFELLGWNSSSYVIAKLLLFIGYPVMTFGETAVTLQTIILALLALYLIFRVARWLKRFSYHWLFARISDLGVRNSLSIFSQYLLVLAGVLITLKVLGIDLTSLAVFAGALGVGIGLGLQDIAKNFISGILLLIERPLRSGDWVILDGSEGTVKSIGMRAITMETFDNQEVIIPNGNAINNSFTNYTHSSSITRTVLYVGAGYDCEPKKVLAVLKDVIHSIDAILSTPAPKIIMWEYADSCINYRVQYRIDVEKHHIWDIKTKVLSAIWYAFQENDIEIPFPQRDINFKNGLPINQADTVK